MGFALGRVGLSLDDFCRLYVDEFEAVCQAYSEALAEEFRASWERARTIVAILIQPYSKKAIKAQDLIRFPWEVQPAGSKAESLAHLERLRRRGSRKAPSGQR